MSPKVDVWVGEEVEGRLWVILWVGPVAKCSQSSFVSGVGRKWGRGQGVVHLVWREVVDVVGVGAGGVQSLGLGVVLEVENLVSGREVEVECWRGSWRLDQGEAHRGFWLVEGRDVRRNGGGAT
jgi:hypothetical protein